MGKLNLNITALQHYGSTTLRHYNITALQHYGITTLNALKKKNNNNYLPLSSHPHPPPSPLPFPLLNVLKKKKYILKFLFLNKYLPLSSQRGFCFFADNYLILLPLLFRFPC